MENTEQLKNDYDAFMYMYLIKFKKLSFDYIEGHRFSYRITDGVDTWEKDIEGKKLKRIPGQKGQFFTIEKNKKFYAQLLLDTVNHILSLENKDDKEDSIIIDKDGE